MAHLTPALGSLTRPCRVGADAGGGDAIPGTGWDEYNPTQKVLWVTGKLQIMTSGQIGLKTAPTPEFPQGCRDTEPPFIPSTRASALES